MSASTVWYRPDKPPDGPKTHALIIGTSRYDYLPKGALKLGQLDCAASAAYRFAKWLKKSYRNESAPLGSIRGLASPSDRERHVFKDDDVLLWPDSFGDNVQEALEHWEKECQTGGGNVAILYACGHGIVASVDHPYVLLRDALKFDNLDNALSIAPTQHALGAGALAASLMFIDACQQISPMTKWDFAAGGGRRLTPPSGPHDEKRLSYPIYYSATPGTFAYGEAGRGTFFCEALIRCLDLLAVRPIGDPPTSWVVTTTSLGEQLAAEVARLRPDQQVLPAGGMARANIHQLEVPPTLPVRLRVGPAERLQWAQGRLKNKSHGNATVPLSFAATEFQHPLACGDYAISVSCTPPPRFVEQVHHIRHYPPDGAKVDIDLVDW
jgi:hypothetical protein